MDPLCDIAGHIGYLGIMVGQIMVGRGSSTGWALRFIGEAIWLGIGVALGSSSMVLWGAVFMAIDLRYWRAWARRAKSQRET